MCRTFLSDEVFDSCERVFIAPERATSAYNSCLHAVWTPSVQSEDAPVESSSEELLEEEDEPAFWQQDPRRFTCLHVHHLAGYEENISGTNSIAKTI